VGWKNNVSLQKGFIDDLPIWIVDVSIRGKKDPFRDEVTYIRRAYGQEIPFKRGITIILIQNALKTDTLKNEPKITFYLTIFWFYFS